MIIDFFYFISTCLNLWIIKSSASAAPLDFMLNRGMMAIGMTMMCNVILQRSFFIPVSPLTRDRMIFGGSGLVTQLLGLNLLPLSIYSLFVRIIPLWFSMLLQNKVVLKSMAVIIFLVIFPFVLENFSFDLLKGILLMIAATFLIALSQIRQVHSSLKEQWWLMPLAPAFGMFCIALLLKIYFKESIVFSSSGIISGLIMCCAYWIAVPVIKNNPKQGKHLLRIDLLGTVLLSVVEIIHMPSLLSSFYLLLTLVVYQFTVRS